MAAANWHWYEGCHRTDHQMEIAVSLATKVELELSRCALAKTRLVIEERTGPKAIVSQQALPPAVAGTLIEQTAGCLWLAVV